MSNPLLVGVDVHRKTNTVCLMNGQGQEGAPCFTVNNNRPGTQAFIQQLAPQMAAGSFDALQIAAQATGWYWWHFFHTLEQNPLLNQWPLALYPSNPRLTANFKKTYSDLDHTDPSDAFLVADRLRLGRDLPPPFHYEERYFPLRLLTRYRFHLVHNLAPEKAYCLTILYLTRTGNRYLRYYFCEAANRVRMCDSEYAAYYQRKYQEGRQHQHKRALVLTAHKLVRLVVRLLRTNQPYRPGRK